MNVYAYAYACIIHKLILVNQNLNHILVRLTPKYIIIKKNKIMQYCSITIKLVSKWFQNQNMYLVLNTIHITFHD